MPACHESVLIHPVKYESSFWYLAGANSETLHSQFMVGSDTSQKHTSDTIHRLVFAQTRSSLYTGKSDSPVRRTSVPWKPSPPN